MGNSQTALFMKLSGRGAAARRWCGAPILLALWGYKKLPDTCVCSECELRMCQLYSPKVPCEMQSKEDSEWSKVSVRKLFSVEARAHFTLTRRDPEAESGINQGFANSPNGAGRVIYRGNILRASSAYATTHNCPGLYSVKLVGFTVEFR
ncbi:hypothetical protein J6590_081494 [Homalodisca vitripennis]|nr:hypothetical protein J6590_081494 [Homalodisca vitripennis]